MLEKAEVHPAAAAGTQTKEDVARAVPVEEKVVDGVVVKAEKVKPES